MVRRTHVVTDVEDLHTIIFPGCEVNVKMLDAIKVLSETAVSFVCLPVGFLALLVAVGGYGEGGPGVVAACAAEADDW
jgi:hypothetical protein